MKKKMNELLNGNIKYEKPKPEFSHDILEGRVGTHEIFRGNFFITAPANQQIKGFLHCTNPRIGFRPDSFSGYRENFVFEADTKGLLPGDRITGDFILNTSLGEYRIPLDIAVEELGRSEKEYHLSTEEFANLAKKDYESAYAVFLSKDFQKELTRWGYRYVNLYRGIRQEQVNYMSLEQFLVGAGLKDPLKLKLEEEKLELKNVEESQKKGLVLQMENWGFAALAIKSDADFLRIEHPLISTEEFVGSRYEISFVIEKEALHAGRNLARITIENGYEVLSAQVEVHNDKRFLPDNDLHRQRLEITQMISVYLDYKTDKLGFSEWAGITQNTLDNYHKCGGNHIFFDLYEAYLAAKLGHGEKAFQLISQVSDRKEELKDPSMYGVYLALTKILNPNENYQAWVKEHIQTLYLENQENWIIQLLMMHVNPETIRNDTERLSLLRRQFLCGCSSPFLYLEGYKILKNEPLMLRNLESFEIHLLCFICREHLLDREISGQVAQIASRMHEFHPLLFRVLCNCFEVFPTKNMLTAICTMLINGRKRSPEYASWYALGIKQDVRITGLYEYFVETAEDINDKMLPSSVRKYFIYHNTLGYSKKAAIYANIVKNREEDPESYEEYLSGMERFTEEQAELSHINEDLAVLYEEVLMEELLTPALAAGLEKILYTVEINCDNPRIKEAIVFHEETELEQRVSLTGGIGYIQLYSPDAVVILEDIQGNRYTLQKDFPLKRMINKQSLEDACRKKLKEPSLIHIHDCSKDGSAIQITDENVQAFIQVLKVPSLKKNYAGAVRTALIDYFINSRSEENLDRFIEQEKEREVLPEKINDWMNILASRDHYEQVMDLIRVYGMEKVSLSVLVRMCHFCILKREYAEDKMLLAVCSYCYQKQMYDEVMLKYLMLYYEGSAQEMKAIWKKGTEYGLESIEMEERILGILIFTEQNLEDSEDIFESYCRRQGKTVLCRTYAILKAYDYFVREKETADFVFYYLENQLVGGGAPDVCRLALMKHLTGLKDRTQEQTKLLCRFVEYYLNRGMRFAFFMDLPGRLKRKLNLQDKFIIEYRTNPDRDVILRYRVNDDKENGQIMQEIFEGIYVKEFTLFYNDEIEWYFQLKDRSEVSEKHRATFEKADILEGNTRYSIINCLMKAQRDGDEKEAQELREQYAQLQHLTDVLFPIN